MRIRRAALAVVAIALLAAGCGDDRLTKEEYIAQADAICKEGNEKMLALAVPTGLEEVAELAGQAIEIQEQAVADLRALKPPEADEAILTRPTTSSTGRSRSGSRSRRRPRRPIKRRSRSSSRRSTRSTAKPPRSRRTTAWSSAGGSRGARCRRRQRIPAG